MNVSAEQNIASLQHYTWTKKTEVARFFQLQKNDGVLLRALPPGASIIARPVRSMRLEHSPNLLDPITILLLILPSSSFRKRTVEEQKPNPKPTDKKVREKPRKVLIITFPTFKTPKPVQ